MLKKLGKALKPLLYAVRNFGASTPDHVAPDAFVRGANLHRAGVGPVMSAANMR
jgi:hypothetical protein